jgi:hypothetical protein
VKYRKPVYKVNCFGAQRFRTESSYSLQMDRAELIMNFTRRGVVPEVGTMTLNPDAKAVPADKSARPRLSVIAMPGSVISAAILAQTSHHLHSQGRLEK